MRLVFVNRYYWPDESATSLMLTDLARGLASAGHQVQVVTSRQLLENPAARLPPKEQQQGVHIHRLRTTTFGRRHLLTRALDYLSFYLSALLYLLWHLRRGDTVIAKTDPPLISVIAAFAAIVKQARLINWLQDVYPEIAFRLEVLREPSVSGRLLLALRNWSLRRASLNVAVGEGMKAFVEKQVARCATVAVVHNWSQPIAHTPVPQHDNPYRQALQLEDKIVFCYSGNLGRAHEFSTLLAAAEILTARTDILFLVIGGGAQLPGLQQQIASRGLQNWRFLPYQPRTLLSDSLGAADVHLVSLHPSLEGMIVPSKIYGILAAGRPAIFIGAADGDVGGLLQRHSAGMSVAPGDTNGLVKALLELADQPARRRQLGENARQAYQQSYQTEAAIRAWRALIGDGRHGLPGESEN